MSFLAVVFVVSGILGGCASSYKIESAGFLEKYGQLEQDKAHKNRRYYEKPGVNWSKYKRIILEPVHVEMMPGSRLKDIDDNELTMLSKYFREQILEVLGEDYYLANDIAPDVMRVRIAITGAEPTNHWLNWLTFSMFAFPVDMGAASIEAEVLDAQSLDRLFAFAEWQEGSRWRIFEGYSRWGHAKAIMERWAWSFRDALDEIHNRQ